MLNYHTILEQYTLAIANPTLNFSKIEQILPWIDSKASYVMIPAISQQVPLDPWKVVLNLLPLSNNLIIDICLPYVHLKSNGAGSVKYSARYFIANQKMLGIRIKCGESWKKNHIQKIRLPQSIIRFYNQQVSHDQSTPLKEECPVGFFYLTFKHFKIAPIFQSEMNNSLLILEQFEMYGCQIFSIIDDTLKKKVGQVSQLQTMLFERSKTAKNIIVYSGIKQSSHPLSCYWANAFVLYNNTQKKCSANPFTGGAQIKVHVNMLGVRKNKIYHEIKQNTDHTNLIQGLNYRCQQIKYRNSINKTQRTQELPNQKPSGQNLLMMYTWYLYNIINHRRPFVMGLPLTEKTTCLLYVIADIVSYLAKNKIQMPESMVMLYKLQINTQLPLEKGNENLMTQIQNGNSRMLPQSLDLLCKNVPMYDKLDELLAIMAANNQQVYFYCDSIDQIRHLVLKSVQNSNIRICRGVLPDQYLTCKIDRQYIRSGQILRPKKKQLQKLCEQVIIRKDNNTLENMVNNFRRKNNNIDELIQAFTQIIPSKIMLNISLNVSHLLFLACSKQQIKDSLAQIQFNTSSNTYGASGLVSKQSKIHDKLHQEKNSHVQTEQKTDLSAKIKKINIFKQNSSKNFEKCHRCQQILKKTYTRFCGKCRQSHCYDCLYKSIGIHNKDIALSEFESMIADNCPVCNEICRCLSCVSKLDRSKQGKNQKNDVQISEKYHVSLCLPCQFSNQQRIPIDIQCSKCKKITCVTCLKRKGQITANYFKQRWICEQCSISPLFDRKVSDYETSKIHNLFHLTENQTVEGIKRRAEMQKREEQKILLLDEERRKEAVSQFQGQQRSRRKRQHKKNSRSQSSSSSKSRSFSSSSSSSSSSAKSKKKRKSHSKSKPRNKSVSQQRKEDDRKWLKQDDKKWRVDEDKGEQRHRNNFNNRDSNERGRGRGRGGRGMDRNNENNWRGRNQGERRWQNRDNQHNNNQLEDVNERDRERRDGYEHDNNKMEKPLWNTEADEKKNKQVNNNNSKLLIFDTKKSNVVEQQFQY